MTDMARRDLAQLELLTGYPDQPAAAPETGPVVRLVVRRPGQPAEQLALRVMAGPTPGFPADRGVCERGPRPCPWTSCREHLWAVHDRPGRRRYAGHAPPHAVVRHSSETCALDVAARGPQSYEEIGRVLGMTPTRVRQVFAMAQMRLRMQLCAEHDAEWGAGAKCEDGCAVCDADDHPSNCDGDVTEEDG